MTRAAWLQHQREQDANVVSAPGTVLASAPPDGFPKRPSLGDETKTVKKDEKKVAKVAKPAVAEKEVVLDREKKVLVQRGLASLGLYKGFMDGAFGPKTSGAIRSWQKAKGYGETGKLTKEQADALAAVGSQTEVKKKSVKKTFELKPVNKTMLVMQTIPLRHSPSLAAKLVGNAEEGQQIQVLAQTKNEGWYQVRVGREIAYLRADFLREWEAKKLSKTMVVKEAVSLRRSPALTSTLAGDVKEGQKVKVTAQTKDWYQVRIGYDDAYIPNQHLRDLRCRFVSKFEKASRTVRTFEDNDWLKKSCKPDAETHFIYDVRHKLKKICFNIINRIGNSRFSGMTNYRHYARWRSQEDLCRFIYQATCKFTKEKKVKICD